MLLQFSCPIAMAADAEEISRFTALEAHQGVAVDAEHVYAIANHEIGKYAKRSGHRVAGWKGKPDGEIVHLNGGVVVEGVLYCGHSDYPAAQPTNTIEMWDTRTMTHLGRRALRDEVGYCNWIDRQDDVWWVLFASYDERSGEQGGGTADTLLVRYDDEWRPTGRFRFPDNAIAKFAPKSCSGGSFGADGLLYCTGHDERELYMFAVDARDSLLISRGTMSMPAPGQGIAWDRPKGRTLYGIDRQSKEVIAMRVPRSSTADDGP